MIEVQCTSCHTRYRIDEQVLPEGMPTFKCSRCGHVFAFEPRKARFEGQTETGGWKPSAVPASASVPASAPAHLPGAEESTRRAAGPSPNIEPQSFAQASVASAGPEPSSGTAAPSHQPDAPAAQPEAPPRPQGPGEQSTSRSSASHPHLTSSATEAGEGQARAVSPQLRARQADEFYSRLLTGKEPDPNLGENLSFDFADEEPALDQARLAGKGRHQRIPSSEPLHRDSDGWEVGDDEPTPTAAAPIRDRNPFVEDTKARPPRRKARAPKSDEPQFANDAEFVEEREAPVYNRAITHSARFFLLMLLLVGVGFGAMTVLIHNAPASAAVVLGHLPFVGDRFVLAATPAHLVALREVSAVYQQSKDAHRALVISGSAENVGTDPLRLVQLTTALRDAERHSLASEAVYCGNNVSAAMISQMTPHEIEFFQKLEPPRTFTLEPSASCRFVTVFMNPPGATNAYDISVSEAIPGAPPTGAEPAS